MKELCNLIDMPPRTYQNYEYGIRVPTAEALEIFSNFYNISVDELLGKNSPDYVSCISDKYNLSENETDLLKSFLEMPENKRAELAEGLQALQAVQADKSPPLMQETTLGEIEDEIARQDAEKSNSNAS